MKNLIFFSSVAIFVFFPSRALSQEVTPNSNDSAMKVDIDGEIRKGEFEKISTNGSITRGLCPYTCEMRALPKQYCKTWRSIVDPTKCYVQDTRIPSQAVLVGNQR